MPEPSGIEFARALARFNLEPLADMDDSWRASLPNAELIDAVSSNARAKARCDKHLLEEAGIADRWSLDFHRPRARLALLPNSTLQSLLAHVGVALRHSDFRRELDGDRVRAARKALGPKLHEFALRTAPLYGDLPNVNVAARDLDMLEQCMLAGAVYALDGAVGADPGYLKRLCWKLPHSVGTSLLSAAWINDQPDASPRPPRLVARILADRFPRWLPLFED